MFVHVINEKHGTTNTYIRMTGFDPRRDVLGWMQSADATQLSCVVDEFSRNKVVTGKNMAVHATIAVHAMAEFIASFAQADASGAKRVTLKQCVERITQMNETKEVDGVACTPTFQREYLQILQQVCTLRSALYPYTSDEQYDVRGELVAQHAGGDAEKMDLAADGSFLTYWHAMQKLALVEAALAPLMQQLSTTGPGQEQLEASIGALKQEQYQNACWLAGRIGGDCEDGALRNVEALTSLRLFPVEIYEHVQSQVGTTFVKGDVETARLFVRENLRFVSNALQAQRVSEPGHTLEYRPVFGFASSPSMQATADGKCQAVGAVTRESCPLYEVFCQSYYPHRRFCGHCFSVLVKISNQDTPKPTVSGVAPPGPRDLRTATISHAEVQLKDLLESTLCNTGKYTDKTFEITTDGKVAGTRVSSGVRIASHAQAREQIGNSMLRQMQQAIGVEFVVHRVVDLSLSARHFYNFFSHIGSGECVVSEATANSKTTLWSGNRTVDELKLKVSTSSFITSAIAWDASLTSTTTSCALVSVPMHAAEEQLLRQIAKEAAPVHTMSRAQHDFMMQRAGHVVRSGSRTGRSAGRTTPASTGTRTTSWCWRTHW